MTILGLDHTGLAVPDLEPARALFAALGFTLTPRETLTRPGPDGQPVSSGADNHVFMLRQGYQELIAVTDPAAGHLLMPRIARYWGLHIVVLASDDAEADRAALVGRGVQVSPCATWGREVPGGGAARFRFFVYAEGEAPEAVLCVVQHLTPDLLRPPHLLDHANGASALRACTLHVRDLAEARARYARLLGAAPAGDVFRFDDGTELRLADAAALASAYPGAAPPAAPAVAAIEFAVARPDRLAAAGVALERNGPAAWLKPQDAFGAIVAFVPAAH